MLIVDIKKKAYDNHVVIEDLYLRVESGERVALVGPSGAGKSTLLNIIAGLDPHYVGSVSADDDDLRGRNSHTLGMMFQEPRLMPWLNVLDNVRLVSADSGAEERARSLLSAVGLDDQLERFPDQLSGGMKKRVAVARAFMPKPRLMLEDEPFASLDAPSAVKLRSLVLQLCDEYDTTLVYVTHDVTEAMNIADRVLFFSAAPLAVLLDFPVKDQLSQSGKPMLTESLCHRLLQAHPQLLQGSL